MRKNRCELHRHPSQIGHSGLIFWFSKIVQFASKSAVFDPAAFYAIAIIPNLYGAIMIFLGFFRSDPLPTPEK
jgi:hypothetical protein